MRIGFIIFLLVINLCVLASAKTIFMDGWGFLNSDGGDYTFEAYNVWDGVSAFEGYNVSDGGVGFEAYNVRSQ